MKTQYLNARRIGLVLITGGFTLAALLSIHFFGEAVMSGRALSRDEISLMNLTIIGLGILSLITGIQITRSAILHRKKHHSSLGLFYGWRIFTTAVIPAAIIAGFSWQYLTYDLGRVFNSRINLALDNALQLTRTAITLRTGQALEQTRGLSSLLSGMTYGELVENIEPLRRQTGAQELLVFDRQGNTVAFSHQDPHQLDGVAPDPATFSRVNEEQETFEYQYNDNQEFTIKIFSNINKLGRTPFYLQAVYPMPDTFNSLAESVRSQYIQHQKYTALQPRIRTNIILAFTITLLLTTLIIIWLSAHFSGRLSHPLRTLSKAADKIAGGDYQVRISDLPKNELGNLGRQFNLMSQSLEEARALNNRSQRQLSTQKARLEAIMDNITGGVLTLDADGRLQGFNQNASKILETDLQKNTPLPMAESESTNSYQELMQALLPCLESGAENWQQEITLYRYSARKILMCHGSHLPDGEQSGHVIVIDDITEFLHAQRNAAWEEVAKRLAHEIKNPLTPIRLQSERLQKRLSDKLTEKTEQQILQKATKTIIDQVDAMQQIVADFSQIARPLDTRRENIYLHIFLHQISELYRENNLQLVLEEQQNPISADPVQLRQVIINLMKNALEAMPPNREAIIRWHSWQKDDSIILTIEDNGSGFTNLDKDPFEPYVTNKPKGTGLGLAIVKKIIHEHFGSISAGNSSELGGAKIVLTFPIHFDTSKTKP